MSPRQGSPVPHELLPRHIGCCQSLATSIFQPPPSRRTTTSSQHARPSGVLRRRSDDLERAAWRPSRPVAQCRQFQEGTKDASVSECTWTLSALEALRNALYKFKTYLLTYLLTYISPYCRLALVLPNFMKFGFTRSTHRRNYICQMFSQSVQGLRSSDTQKIAISHWLAASPLQRTHYRATLSNAKLVVISNPNLGNTCYMNVNGIAVSLYFAFVNAC